LNWGGRERDFGWISLDFLGFAWISLDRGRGIGDWGWAGRAKSCLRQIRPLAEIDDWTRSTGPFGRLRAFGSGSLRERGALDRRAWRGGPFDWLRAFGFGEIRCIRHSIPIIEHISRQN
jgi:hypothetical protein